MKTAATMLICLLSVMVLIAQTEDLPIDDGNIVIRAQFIRDDGSGSYFPELALKLTNQTSASWRTLKLQFDIGALCNGEPRQWTIPVFTSLGFVGDHELVKEYTEVVISLVGKVDGCKTEIIKTSLIFADGIAMPSFRAIHIDGVYERIDFTNQLQELKVKHEAEAAAEAQAQAIRDAALAARQKREEAEEAARQKREEAAAAFKRRKARAACTVIYHNTIDKKVNELTVREEEQVRACQALDLYPPQ
jgi:uncharacterized membrane protein